MWYRWEAMVDWNITVDKILEERRTKVEKNEDGNFSLNFVK